MKILSYMQLQMCVHKILIRADKMIKKKLRTRNNVCVQNTNQCIRMHILCAYSVNIYPQNDSKKLVYVRTNTKLCAKKT